MFERFAGQNVLLLQGPVGPFFHWLGLALLAQNVTLTKVNLNAADAWYFGARPALSYRGGIEEWAAYLASVVADHKIDAIFLFGDSRPYHVIARGVAEVLQVPVFVFEEGYLRPHYVTFEEGGTNFQSRIPKDPDAFLSYTQASAPEPRKVGQTFWYAAWYASVYAVVLSVFSWRYPKYKHHRNWNPVRQAAIWWLSAGRKVFNQVRELGLLREITQRQGHYFLVPLQVHDDYQVQNSHYDSVEAFIQEVVASFARNAPAEAFLVLKHHPQDRGYRDYHQLLTRLEKQFSLTGRIYYVHDLHLPTLLDQARGSVVINSTVGLSSLLHNTPVKCLDKCIYTSCTSKQSLHEFWRAPAEVNEKLVHHHISWLKTHVLLNGSFYQSRFWEPTEASPSLARAPSSLAKRNASSHSA